MKKKKVNGIENSLKAVMFIMLAVLPIPIMGLVLIHSGDSGRTELANSFCMQKGYTMLEHRHTNIIDEHNVYLHQIKCSNGIVYTAKWKFKLDEFGDMDSREIGLEEIHG